MPTITRRNGSFRSRSETTWKIRKNTTIGSSASVTSFRYSGKACRYSRPSATVLVMAAAVSLSACAGCVL